MGWREWQPGPCPANNELKGKPFPIRRSRRIGTVNADDGAGVVKAFTAANDRDCAVFSDARDLHVTLWHDRLGL